MEANVFKHKKSRTGTTTWHPASAPPDDIPARALRGQEVVFLGWQKSMSDIFPLYNILKIGHPSYRSTVTEKTLQSLHLRIPRTPSPYPGVTPSPWHTMGTELTNPATAREAIEAAGLDFTVVKKPLKEVMELKQPADAFHRWATVRTDTGDVLGVVGDSYEPIQNRDAFTFFDNLVGTDEAIYETAGTLGRGERIWILAKLPGYIKVHGRDIVSKYLLLSNSHDGSSLVRVKLTPIRVVCNNTLTAALRGAGEVHIRHTSNAAEDMEQALSLLGLSNSLFERLDAVFNRMALTNISDKQLMDYVKALVPDTEEGKNNANAQKTRKAFLELYESGQGADLSRGTLWGAFNCVTEYTDHRMEGNPASRMESIWFGRGEQLKLKAFQLAERMM
jgi:phage/plasmid-like protein (TIGR03299 family)